MSQLADIALRDTDRCPDYGELWRAHLPRKRRHQLTRELKRLYRMPMTIDLDLGNCYNLHGRPWINPATRSEALAIQLLSRLMSVFLADHHFALIAERLDYANQYYEGVKLINVTVNIPLTAFWAYRRFPYLCRELFNSAIKSHFSKFRDISLQQFFSYAPCFVLADLAAALQLERSANWVHWIVSGRNIRHAPDLPFPLTRKMAHLLIQAPEDLRFDRAFFYAQIRGLGGSHELFSHLDLFLDHYFLHTMAFRATVIRYFIRQGYPTEFEDLQNLIGYFQHCYFNGNFHFEKRSLTTVMREMREWYAEMEARENVDEEYLDASWVGSPYQGFTIKKAGVQHRIVQLTTYKELCDEGSTLKHCVSTYVEDCMAGRSSIWSLRRYASPEDFASLVTIALDPNGAIVEALGNRNAYPKEEELKIIRQWAAAEGLLIHLT